MSPLLVLVLTLVYLAVVLGLRTYAHYRRTGSSGFKGISGRWFSLEWWGGAAFALGIVLAVAAPVANLLAPEGVGALVGSLLRASQWLEGSGGVLYFAGFAGTYLSQSAMGSSWRIGVDERERTALVTSGVFGWVRNPIFTSMLVAAAGLFLLLPTFLGLFAFVSILVAVELQVRCVEEPYLLGVHGDAYREYARRAGRFLPGIGRLKGM